MTFSERVYAVVSRIPPGKVSTYSAVALALGTQAYQAVGQLLSRNPYAPRVPCHRVVRADRRLGGLMGSPENAKKRLLLEEEGVLFDKAGRVHKECMVTLSK